jgi:hypothetical protein
MFASIALIWLAMGRDYLPPLRVFLTVIIFGGFAIGYAAGGLARRHWLIPVLMIGEGFWFGIIGSIDHNAPQLIAPDSPLQKQLMLLQVGSIASVVVGYILFRRLLLQPGLAIVPRTNGDRAGGRDSSRVGSGNP